MIGRRTVVGLSLLCALLFSAIAVQSASAAKAINTTVVTCVPKANGDFEDSHCDKKVPNGTGFFAHEPIANDTTTKTEGEQLGSAVMKSKAAGAAVEVTCTKKEATGELHNVLHAATKQHTVTGKLKTTFSSCTVNKPAKCVVAEPIVTNTEFEGVEGLGAGKNEMGVEHKPEGGGGTFVELTFENKGAEKCNIAGKFPVTGTAVQTGAVAPTEKHTGSKGIFTKSMTEETLKFGPEKASFEVSETVRMAPKENGMPLTTVT